MYDYDTARLTEAILEDNLPPHIRELPKDLIRIPPDTDSSNSVPLEERIDKRLGLKETIHLLDDRSDFDRVKDFILNTGYGSSNSADNLNYYANFICAVAIMRMKTISTNATTCLPNRRGTERQTKSPPTSIWTSRCSGNSATWSLTRALPKMRKKQEMGHAGGNLVTFVRIRLL